MNEEKSSFIKGINEQRPTAYHQLYNEYYKALVLYAINFLSSQQAAEDIVQDLFATMCEKKMRFLSLPSFRTYLYNSIRNASLNYLKHQNVESLYLERLASTYREITEEEDTNEEEKQAIELANYISDGNVDMSVNNIIKAIKMLNKEDF